MKTGLSLALVLLSTVLFGKRPAVAVWTNKGDVEASSQHFAADGTFTNIVGMFFTGHEAFRERRDQIFKGVLRGTTKQEDIVSIVSRPDVAVVETLQTVTGVQKLFPGTSADAKGRLRTRLLQILVKDNGEWKIVVYHNVDVKPGGSIPEPSALQE